MARSINSVPTTHRIHRLSLPTYSIGWKFSKASRARNAQLYTNFIRFRALGDRKGEGWKIRWNYLAPRSPWIKLFERSLIHRNKGVFRSSSTFLDDCEVRSMKYEQWIYRCCVLIHPSLIHPSRFNPFISDTKCIG